MLRRAGQVVNRKLVQRLYRNERSTVRRRKWKRIAVLRSPLAAPVCASDRWSMDFFSDAPADGRNFRSLTLVDDFTRECAVLEVDVSLQVEGVTQMLYRVAAERALRRGIASENGPEFAGQAREQWSH